MKARIVHYNSLVVSHDANRMCDMKDASYYKLNQDTNPFDIYCCSISMICPYSHCSYGKQDLHSSFDSVPRNICGLENANRIGSPNDNVFQYTLSYTRHCNIFDCDVDIVDR